MGAGRTTAHATLHPRRCLKRSRLGKCERWAPRVMPPGPATPPIAAPHP